MKRKHRLVIDGLVTVVWLTLVYFVYRESGPWTSLAVGAIGTYLESERVIVRLKLRDLRHARARTIRAVLDYQRRRSARAKK